MKKKSEFINSVPRKVVSRYLEIWPTYASANFFFTRILLQEHSIPVYNNGHRNTDDPARLCSVVASGS